MWESCARKLQAIGGGQKGPKLGGVVHPTSSSSWAHWSFHVQGRQRVKENKALKCCSNQSPTDRGHHRLTYLTVPGPRRPWPGGLAELPLQPFDLLLELFSFVLPLSSLLLEQEAACEDSTLGDMRQSHGIRLQPHTTHVRLPNNNPVALAKFSKWS